MGIRRRAVLATAVAVVTVPFAATMAASAATTAPVAMSASTAAPAAHTASTSAATVITTERTKFGTVLVTGTGGSLYNFSGDNLPFSTTGVELNCTALNKAASGEACTTAWIPLTASSVIAKGGVQQRDLGTVTRNGVKQVTYFGHPLYTFIADTAPNDVNGEDVSAFSGQWYLTQTDGMPQAETPTVSTEISPNGIVLSSATASGTRSLYMLTADSPRTATCGTAGGCEALWPPLLTNSFRAIAGTGTDRHLFGAVRRSDGTFQVTYAGHPLYFFALDPGAGATAGETNGEHLLDPSPVDGVWYNLLPNGNPDAGTANIQSEASGSTNILADAGVVNGVVATLYAFSADSSTMSNCNGECAKIWPPVLTQSAPTASGSATGSLLGAIPRGDGTFQVTYDGHPLYYFADALDSGTEGAGVTAFGGTFNTVNVSGAVG
jgi:predicted lipoprotein with Yx(FWY)xxD motif